MSAILNSFKVKDFDLAPVFAAWPDAPVFRGNSKKDPRVDAWLDQIRAGCEARNVPEAYWHKVAQHYLGPHARARLDAFKQVLYNMNGGKYRWTWKKFRLAMQNMGWEMDAQATVPVKVQKRSSGSWWVVRRKEDEAPMTEEPEEIKRSGSSSSSSKGKDKDDGASTTSKRTRRTPIRAMSDSLMAVVQSTPPPVPPKPQRANTEPIETTVANAPAWMVNACKALEFLTCEHPKAMTAISAILIVSPPIPRPAPPN